MRQKTCQHLVGVFLIAGMRPFERVMCQLKALQKYCLFIFSRERRRIVSFAMMKRCKVCDNSGFTRRFLSGLLMYGCLLVFSITANAQRDSLHAKDYSGKPAPIIVGGINIGTWITGELRIGFTKYATHRPFTWNADEFTLGSEINFQKSGIQIGPKISYTRTHIVMFFGVPLGGSLTYFTDFEQGAMYFTPMVGFEIFFVLRAMGGYNIPLSPYHQLDNVSTFTLSLQLKLFNIDKYL